MKEDPSVITPPTLAEAPRKGNYKRPTSFSRGDVAALVSGALLVFTLVSLLCFLVAENVMRDRAVGAGRPASAAPTH
jgi:hypothetical protein